MIKLQDLANAQTIVPGALILILFVLVLSNLIPASPLAPGTVLYEKSNFGYQPVFTTDKSNLVRIHRQLGNFVQIGLKDPPAKLWVPAQAVASQHPLPAQLFLSTHAGKLGPMLPPFVEKQLTIRYGQSGTTQGPTSKQTSVHVLFSLFLLAVILLVLRSQMAKNTLGVMIGCFLLFYSVYASGLVKSSLEAPQAGIVRILDLVRTGNAMTIYCESPDLLKLVQSRHGNNIATQPMHNLQAASRGYLLSRTPAGAPWKLLATDGKVLLYYRD